MAENSGISWTDHTFNPWIGCTNVSPACDHCYAENLATNRLGVGWGNDAERRRTAPANWSKVRRWNNKADAFKAEHGRYPRVFAASLADIFDNKVDPAWRADFWALVKECTKLQWLIVTKRIGNVRKMLPADWGLGYRNVVLIITVANQKEADRDIPHLVSTPARYRGLSIEPMLGPVTSPLFPILDWIITGGESRQLPGPRDLVPLETQWVRDVAKQCAEFGVPHHFKQWGYTIPVNQIAPKVDWPHHVGDAGDRTIWREHNQRKDGPACSVRDASHDMGRMLDGIEHNGFPPTL